MIIIRALRHFMGLFLLVSLLGSLLPPALAQAPPKVMVKGCSKGDAKMCYAAGINQSARNPGESRRYLSLSCAGLGN